MIANEKRYYIPFVNHLKLFLMGLIILHSGILFPREAKGQDHRVITYQMEQGLPFPVTKTIGQDDQGFIWIGTDNGLIRFDGRNFLHYKDALPSHYIKSFFQNRQGHLLVIHDLGVTRILNKNGQVYFEPYCSFLLRGKTSSLKYPKGAYEDQQGNFWVAEFESVSRFKDGQQKQFKFEPKTIAQGVNRSYQFVEDSEGVLWVISQQGYFFYFDQSSDSFFEAENTTRKQYAVSGVLKTSQNKIWLACNEGVFELEVNQHKQITGFHKLANHSHVSSIIEDQDGNYFFGTWYKKLFKAYFENNKLKTTQIYNLPFNSINNLFQTDNDVWVSSSEGIALVQPIYFTNWPYESESPFIQSLTHEPAKGELYFTNAHEIVKIEQEGNRYTEKNIYKINDLENIVSLAASNDKVYYTTSSHKLYCLENGIATPYDIETDNPVWNLHIDKNGTLWMNNNGKKTIEKVVDKNKVVVYDQEKGIVSFTFIMKEDPNGVLYCGGLGENSYLYRYEKAKDRFENISRPLPFEASNITVDDLAIGADESLWLATNYGPIFFSKDTIYKVPIEQLSETSSIFKSITIDNNGQVWFGSSDGVYKYIPESGHLVHYDDFSGMPSQTIGYRSMTVDKNGRLWTGTASGIYFAQSNNRKVAKTPTPVFITLQVNDREITEQNLVFPDNSYLVAEFVSPSYPGHTVKYQYRIKKLTDDWICLDGKNEITIPQLSHGNYILEVKALQKGEFEWSDPIAYAFQVDLPWYLDWKALGLFTFMFGLIMWSGIRLNTYRLNREKEFLTRIVLERTSEIINQKHEIEAQRDELQRLNVDILAKNEEILHQKKEIESQRDTVIEMNKELEILNSTKDRFFSIIAHDLKGPLNSLASFSDILYNFTDSMTVEEIKKVAFELNNALKNTVGLTENLLTWARSQMKNLPVEKKNLILNDLVEEIFTILLPAAQAKGINLQKDLAERLEFWGDKDQVSFVLRNLIANAIKFTHKEGIVTIKAVKEGDFILTSVTDTGVGMHESVIAKIFDISTKHSTSGTRGEKGTGLGLLLCKEFLDKSGGNIWVESKENIGSCFYFTLKIAQPHHEDIKVR
jgi:signal transduction histidine kinase/ligand-binding sensor domain-containing protein